MGSTRIYPLHVGTITRQITNFCHGIEPGICDFPLIAWYIEGSDKRILVDTGGGDPSAVHVKLQPYKRNKEHSIEYALKKFGLTCADIEMVIMTHLHWDHSGDNRLFPNARFIVQEEELRTARDPFPNTIFAYIRDVVENVSYHTISGDVEIAKDVHLVLTPGHTYGLQGVLVNCEKKRIFLASDTLPLFKNIESDPPVISNLYVDIRSYYESLRKIQDLSAVVLPGHDFRVLDEEVYY
jgi:glyoxylase-like metal-dependent hydrolase (beta-lactamase superfamily II)